MKRALAQALIAIVLTLVAIEVSLQIISLFANPLVGRSHGLDASSEAITILCVGDSHTYGAPLPGDEAYPAQLQERLEKEYPSREFQVINLGFPGVNSDFVASRLERQILQLRPHVVIISAGLNNRWNELKADDAETDDGTWAALRRALLRVKLIRLAAVAGDKGRFAPPLEGGDGRWHHPDQVESRAALVREGNAKFQGEGLSVRPTEAQVHQMIDRDMERMVRTTREHDTPVIWYSYPGHNAKNQVIMRVINKKGDELGIPVVRAREGYMRASREGYEHEDLFIWGAGFHPTGLLYGYVVESMVPVVAEQLKEWHGIDLDEERD